MNDPGPLSISELRRKRGEGGAAVATETDRPRTAGAWETPAATPHPLPLEPTPRWIDRLGIDPWRLPHRWRRQWYWIGLVAVTGVVVGGGGAWLWSSTSAEVRLVPEPRGGLAGDGAGAVAPPAAVRPDLLETLARSPRLLVQAGALAQPPVSPAWLADHLEVTRDGQSDTVVVRVRARAAARARHTADACATALVQAARAFADRERQDMTAALTAKLHGLEAELATAHQALTQVEREAGVFDFERQTTAEIQELTELERQSTQTRLELAGLDAKLTSLRGEVVNQNPDLVATRAELNAALTRYTEAHPRVKELRARLRTLEQESASGPGQGATGLAVPAGALGSQLALLTVEAEGQKRALAKQLDQLTTRQEQLHQKLNGLSDKAARYAQLKGDQAGLETTRRLWRDRLHQVQTSATAGPAPYRALAPATLAAGQAGRLWSRLLLAASLGGLLGGALAAVVLAALEAADARLKTAADARRVIRLPLISTLGDLHFMDADEQAKWAFRAWTSLKGRLAHAPERGLVCGFTSSAPGEGRTTCINLLAQAAGRAGWRVLTVAARPAPPDAGADPAGGATQGPDPLASPGQVAREVSRTTAGPVTHVPLPAWDWSRERRQQWAGALACWGAIRDAVLFIELPPASLPETVLLAEGLPNLVWVAAAGQAEAGEVQAGLTTLRQAGCHLVGTLFNRAPRASGTAKTPARVGRWLATAAAVGMLAGAGPRAAEAPPTPASTSNVPVVVTGTVVPLTPAQTNVSFSVISPGQRAPWQEHLVLGPGDGMMISVYGEPDLTRTNVVQPDGRITYLQAQDVAVTGLTVDELRAKLDGLLAQYYRSPRTMINPLSFLSKRFYLLGNVSAPGVFILERPITIIEALALAHGFIATPVQSTMVESVDLGRSFLVRRGERVAVDFEGLFFGGKLDQNLPVEPDDYLYFPPANLKEVYVLGEVRAPGVVPYAPGTTTLVGALSRSGGFTDDAFKQRVLVVRGSLNHPTTFVVNVGGVLAARRADFKLEPRDIIYVSKRPWLKAEQLLDMVASTFVNTVAFYWAGAHVGPFITHPIF